MCFKGFDETDEVLPVGFSMAFACFLFTSSTAAAVPLPQGEG